MKDDICLNSSIDGSKLPGREKLPEKKKIVVWYL